MRSRRSRPDTAAPAGRSVSNSYEADGIFTWSDIVIPQDAAVAPSYIHGGRYTYSDVVHSEPVGAAGTSTARFVESGPSDAAP